jgi:putative FmdB family regulatory protein
MPTYEYECRACGQRFERQQGMTEAPLAQCPKCGGEVRRLISGGSGFIMKGNGEGRLGRGASGCSLEAGGQTCCGRDERCGKPPCGGARE